MLVIRNSFIKKHNILKFELFALILKISLSEQCLLQIPNLSLKLYSFSKKFFNYLHLQYELIKNSDYQIIIHYCFICFQRIETKFEYFQSIQ